VRGLSGGDARRNSWRVVPTAVNERQADNEEGKNCTTGDGDGGYPEL
jgi:hypothetical protein